MNQAISQTSYYALASIIRNATSLVMLPIYTRYLTPGDYGVIELMTIALDLTGILVCNRIGEAIFRYYQLAQNEQEKARTMGTAFVLAIMINCLAFGLIFFFHSSVASFIDPSPEFANLFLLFAVTLIFEAIAGVTTIYLRIRNLAKHFLLVNVIRLVIQVALNIYFVVVKDLHVAGVVYSAVISNFLVAILLGIYFVANNGLHFVPKMAYKIFTFSIPMVFVACASFVITFGDRYFLKVYGTLDDVGIYSLAYKFGFLFIALSWDPFYKYWEGQRYTVWKADNAGSQFEKYFVYLSLWLLLFGTLVSIFIDDFLRLFTTQDYYSAAKFVPIIIAAFIFHAWSGYCNFGIFLKEKTRYMAYIEIISAILILALYWLLIPEYGVLGAALATLLGYFISFLLMTATSFQFYRLHLPWGRVSTILAFCVILTTIVRWTDYSQGLSLPMKVLVVMMFFVLMYVSPLLKNEERIELKFQFRQFKEKVFG